MFLFPNTDLSIGVQMAAREPLCLCRWEVSWSRRQVSQAEIEGPKQPLESTGEASQPARTFGTHRGTRLKKGPTHNRVRSLYQQYEEYEARNCWIWRNCAPRRGQHHHAANLGHDVCPPSRSSGVTSGQCRTAQSQWRTA